MVTMYYTITLLGIVALINFIIAVKSILYRAQYKNWSKRFNKKAPLKAAIFVPCKGVEQDLKEHLDAIALQDSENLQVYYICESKSDPAFEIIDEIVKKRANTEVVISGKTVKSCQKNHNILAGMRLELAKKDPADIFIIADSDIQPGKSWLEDLLLPLTSPEIAATTAYRWLKPEKFTFWGTMHAMLSGYLGTLMSSSKGMWGGSMAIKREVLLQYGVLERWGETLGDDIPLMKVILENKLKRVFVPSCTAESRDVITDGKELYEWFVRQNQYLKIYCPTLWIITLILTCINSLSVILAPIFILISLFTPILSPYILPSLIYMLAMLFIMALSRFEGKDGQSFFTWLLMAYPAMVLGVATLIASGLRKDLVWKGIRYGIGENGTVSYIK